METLPQSFFLRIFSFGTETSPPLSQSRIFWLIFSELGHFYVFMFPLRCTHETPGKMTSPPSIFHSFFSRFFNCCAWQSSFFTFAYSLPARNNLSTSDPFSLNLLLSVFSDFTVHPGCPSRIDGLTCPQIPPLSLNSTYPWGAKWRAVISSRRPPLLQSELQPPPFLRATPKFTLDSSKGV